MKPPYGEDAVTRTFERGVTKNVGGAVPNEASPLITGRSSTSTSPRPERSRRPSRRTAKVNGATSHCDYKSNNDAALAANTGKSIPTARLREGAETVREDVETGLTLRSTCHRYGRRLYADRRENICCRSLCEY